MAQARKRTHSQGLRHKSGFWGSSPFDAELEETIGDANKLLETEIGRKMEEIVAKNWEP